MRCLTTLLLLLGAIAFCFVSASPLANSLDSSLPVDEAVIALVDPIPPRGSYASPSAALTTPTQVLADDEPTITKVVPSSFHIRTLAFQGTIYATIHLDKSVNLPLEFEVFANGKPLTVHSSFPVIVALTSANILAGDLNLVIRPTHSEDILASLDNAIKVYGTDKDTFFLASAVTAILLGRHSDSADTPPSQTFAVMGATASDVQIDVNGAAPYGLTVEEAEDRSYFTLSFPPCPSIDECLAAENIIKFVAADGKGSFTTVVPFIHAPYLVSVTPNTYDRGRGSVVGITLSLSASYKGKHPITITADDPKAVIEGTAYDVAAKTIFFRLQCAECELGAMGVTPQLPTLHPSDVPGSLLFMTILRGDDTPKGGNGLDWPIIVLIVVAPLVVIGLVILCVMRRRAKARRSEAIAFQAHLYASHGYSDDGYLPA